MKGNRLKTYILDTNVLLSDPNCIVNFEDNNVIIPMTCIEELDKFKKDKSELGANARAFSRNIDLLRLEGDLVSGIQFKSEDDETVHSVAVFVWETIAHKAQNYIDSDFTAMDDRILAVALYMAQDNEEEVIFVTNDINLRIRADIYGLKAEEYKHGRVKHNELYSGIQTVEVSSDTIDSIYSLKGIGLSLINSVDPYPNECFIFKSGQQSALCIYNYSSNLFKLIPQDLKTSGIMPKNVEQQFALALLRDHKIPLISMIGQAGTGKSLVSLAAAIRAVVEFQDYDKIMLLKPIISMDNANDIGYLPKH